MDQADVAGGAAHVQAQHVGLAGQVGEQQRPVGTAGGTGEHGEGGVGAGAGEVGEPAGGLHDLRLAEPLGARLRGQSAQVIGKQRRERCVDDGGGGALVLAEGADELAGERDVDVGQQLREQLREQALVGGVGVGVQQRYGDGLGPRAGDLLHEGAGGACGERLQRAIGPHPLGCAEAQRGGHQRRGCCLAEPVEMRAGLAGELDDVGEAGSGDQRGARGGALEHGVGGHRHTVGEALDIARARAGAREHQLYGCEHADRLVGWRGGHLGGVDGDVAVDEHGVGEGAADVDAQEHASQCTPGRAVSSGASACGRRARRRQAHRSRCRPGADGRGSSRYARAACAGRQSPCGWWRGTAAARR